MTLISLLIARAADAAETPDLSARRWAVGGEWRTSLAPSVYPAGPSATSTTAGLRYHAGPGLIVDLGLGGGIGTQYDTHREQLRGDGESELTDLDEVELDGWSAGGQVAIRLRVREVERHSTFVGITAYGAYATWSGPWYEAVPNAETGELERTKVGTVENTGMEAGGEVSLSAVAWLTESISLTPTLSAAIVSFESDLDTETNDSQGVDEVFTWEDAGMSTGFWPKAGLAVHYLF